MLASLLALWVTAMGAAVAEPASRLPLRTAAASAVAPAAAEGDPATLLARFKMVTGGAAWDALHALHTHGTLTTGGLSGTFDSWEELGTGRGLGRYQLGPVSGAEGFDGETPWSQDASGEVTFERGEESLEATRNEAYRTALAWWYPQRWPATVRALPPRHEGDRGFARLEITPRGGRPFELWLDVASGLPDRAVERGGTLTTTTFLDDWRRVAVACGTDGGGAGSTVLLPFRARSTNGEEKYDVLMRADAIDVDPPLAVDAFAPPARPVADFAIAGGAASARLPFQVRNNHVYVEVTLDGEGPLVMLFDSGGFNVVTPETAARLGLATEGALQARGVGEGSEDLALTRVGTLELGGATLRDQVFSVLPLAGLPEVEGVPVAGIVGFEVLQRFVVEVDYAKRELTLTLPERLDAGDAGTPVPFVFADHMPAVEGSVDGIAGRFTLDTGSRSALSLHRPFVETHGLLARYQPTIEATTGWGVGGGVRAKVTRAGMLHLGGVEVPLPITELVTSDKGALADRYLAGNVGGGILRRFRVTFDYRHERVYLAPGGDAGPDSFDRAGLWLTPAGRGLAVEDVVPGGPAAAAGVLPGDRLEAVDGVALGKLGPDAVRARLRRAPPGSKLRLRVRGAGGSREVEVVLAELPAPPP